MIDSQDALGDQRTLEAFVVDNSDLEQLEAHLGQFNIFEVIGAVRQEIRHSDFLAFLLNPKENHGLGDEFVTRLLQKSLLSAHGSPTSISPIDLDVWNLDNLLVLREWRDLDILLVDESKRFVVIIENKIDSGEHSQQLKRYHELAAKHYPNYKIIGLYLTPDGKPPSNENYVAIDYTLISEILVNLAKSRASTLGPDVQTLILHYIQMLRRHIVSDSDIAQLCRQIYRKHQQALDLIYEHRPDLQAEIQSVLLDLIEKSPDLILDYYRKSLIQFGHRAWEIDDLKMGEGWTDSRRILLFGFENLDRQLRVRLLIGPGPKDIRQRLFDTALQNTTFKTTQKLLGAKWNQIFVRGFLRPKDYENAGMDELEPKIRKKWDVFMETDLPKVIQDLRLG